MMQVPFGDLRRQYNSIRNEIDDAVRRVFERGWFVLGTEVESFEQQFAAYLGVRHVVGVGSGTEALHLALVGCGAGHGDEVVTAPNTCVPTASAISAAGAVPVFADVDPATFNLDPHELERAITARTKAVVPVHLYGQAADLDPILDICQRLSVPVIEDNAQGHGATYKGKRLGTIGAAGCFSFYPSKNLGAFGDGGAVATNDDNLAGRLRRLRNYGEETRYYHSSKGFNSRLDEVQAAILAAKLPYLDAWNARRQQIASLYDREITNPLVTKPARANHGTHAYHLYVLRCERRDEFREHLTTCGVGTQVHYPVPIHLQEAYRELGHQKGAFPVAEECCAEVLSLPVYPELTDEECRYVARCVEEFK
ncbi:MAG TPA: DegT/DnrJ/EryC1/StrS family aminotransferase [Blastocatellia bacterium]|nr:DegT/DnrJ/EryC1/StrS family aminotransferase [Blastocatellia bacterium]